MEGGRAEPKDTRVSSELLVYWNLIQYIETNTVACWITSLTSIVT